LLTEPFAEQRVSERKGMIIFITGREVRLSD